MKTSVAALGLMAATMATPVFAGTVPTGIPKLTHVWVIMMENHGFAQLYGNSNAPFINQYMTQANLANNYYAVAHPSLTNYLEATGGSNFGVQDDNSPDWHNASCQPNIATGVTNTEASSNAICPIAGTGTDAVTPAIDTTNEAPGQKTINVDGVVNYPAAATAGQTIADQLIAAGMTWRSYQEDLPITGADGVDNSDGQYSNLTDFTAIQGTPAHQILASRVVALYAVKHNPFVYFKSIQENGGLANVAGFERLYYDLGSGNVPAYSFIAPNQCHDQHGKSNAGQSCAFDPADNGTQDGLNPGLINAGDITVHKLVFAIKNSPAWKVGHNAIILVWDENDYSLSPIKNQVIATVDTNYGVHKVTSDRFYTHFSLLKSIEAGFGLPCLNHACDASVHVMSDLFATK
jgi:hypothetical protein